MIEQYLVSFLTKGTRSVYHWIKFGFYNDKYNNSKRNHKNFKKTKENFL